jgi:hypothetical protein
MTALKRLALVFLALAFLAGLTAQSLFAASIDPARTANVMAGAIKGDSADGQTPCKGTKPLCTDHAGCVLMTALTITPGLAPVPVEWDEIKYGEFTVAFEGLSVAPELSPPIPTI